MSTLNYGVATSDITPPLGVMLMGYEPRPATSVGYPLRAEALACSNAGGDGWIMVSADVCAFNSRLTRLVSEDVAATTGLPPEAVVLAATHTHSGPHVTDALWCERSPLESSYFATLREKLAAVAITAWQQRAPGELLYGRTTAPELGFNRRIKLPDGNWSNKWTTPEAGHQGYFDPTVELIGVRRPDGALAALLVNFGCHPVVLGSSSSAISGDYVGYLKQVLERDGGVETALFTVSGHANVDPQRCVQAEESVARELGERLAEIVVAALPELQVVAGHEVAAVRESWEFDTTWQVSGRVGIYFPHAGHGKPVATTLSGWRVGELAFLGLPGETVSEYRQQFEALSPFKRTIMVSLVNDFIGYLATDAILTEGAYEAMMTPLNPLEEELKRRGKGVLQQLK